MRALALLLIAAVVLLPGLHVHGSADAACPACVHQSALTPAPGPASCPVLEPPGPAGVALREPAAELRPRIPIYRPVALSPPASLS